MIKPLEWVDGSLKILDQNRLPWEEKYEHLSTPREVAEAIKSLKVRGAPLIGVAAAWGMVMAAPNYSGSRKDPGNEIRQAYQLLWQTRPTAVNLHWALDRMLKRYEDCQDKSPEEIGLALEQEAMMIQTEDAETNLRISKNGAQLFSGPCRILTICNAGALATTGQGTALGVVRSLHAAEKLEMVWVLETRPVLQGARLTVWELDREGIPVTLITDGMAGYVIRKHRIDAVITGADRIALNGDTANKIGTYSLAVLARYHNIPFYIAAPFSTFDFNTPDGEHITIETRDQDEVRMMGGRHVTLPHVSVFNPAFDVTPAALITGIITEKGVLLRPEVQGIKRLAGF